MEKVCKVSDVPKAAMKGFTVKSRQILIANVDGNFYAVDAICPHMNGYLPSGKLERNEVVCPVHRARYNVATGKLVKVGKEGGSQRITAYVKGTPNNPKLDVGKMLQEQAVQTGLELLMEGTRKK